MPKFAIAFIVVGALAVAGTASAQSDEDKAEARKLLKAGDKLLKRGDRFAKRGRTERAKAAFEEALDNYNRAHKLVPNPSIYFPIGQAEERLGRYVDAIGHYNLVLDESPQLGEPLRKAVEARIEASLVHVAVLVVIVNKGGAEVSVDGESRGTAPMSGPIYLEPGEHKVAVTLDGHTPLEETLQFEAGQEQEQNFELEPVPVRVDKPEPPPKPEPEPDTGLGAPSRTGLLVGGIITATLALGATATGLGALDKQGTFDDEDASLEDREAARDSGKTLALSTDLLIAGAVIAGAYTAYHYFKVYRPRQAEYNRAQAAKSASRPKLWVAPYVDTRGHARGGGLALGGRF